LKAIFTADEPRKLYGRFRTARQYNQGVATKYDQVANDKTSKGGAKRAASVMLVAWLVDPEMDELFWDVAQGISYSEGVTSESTWMSQKQLCDKYGESDAEEMIDQGLVQ
ncbi:unnamed protein product, partial [Prorocentrum cordatum]